jgi:signal transduction histidine kinase/HAMP domain-containing protein
MSKFSFSSLRARLLVLVLIAVIPAFGLIDYTSSKLRQVLSRDAQNDALHLVRALAAEHERIIESGHQLLIALANLPQVFDYDSAACAKVFSNVGKHFRFFTRLAAAKPNGDVFCSSVASGEPVNFSDRPYFKQVLKTRAFTVSDFTIGRFTKKPIITLSYPSLNEIGEVRAVLVIGLDLSWFRRSVAEARLPHGSSVTVIDRNGVILARDPEPEDLTGKSAPEAAIVKIVRGSREGTTEAAGGDGVPHVYAFTALGGSSDEAAAYVWAGIPKSAVFAEADRLLAINAAGFGVVAILTLVLAWTGSSAFVLRRVNALITATKKIAHGDLAARTGLTYDKGEFGQLSHSFDSMAESLERRYKQLKALHEIDLAISSTLDLRRVLGVLLDQIDSFLPYAVTTVRLLNKETGELESFACRNIDEDEWKQATANSKGGLASMLPQDNSSVIVGNAQTDPRSLAPEFLRKHGLVSSLRVPLIAKNEVSGVLTFFTKQEHEFSGEEVEYLTTIAGQAAIAIDNGRLYEETKQKADELAALHALTAATAQSLDLNVVLKEAIRKITEIFHFDATRIFLFNAGMDALEVRAAFEVKPEFWTQVTVFQRGQGIVGRVADTGEPLIFEDIHRDPRYRELSQSKISEKAGAFFLAMFPIKTKAKTWGAMVCVGENPRKLGGNEINLLTSMTSQIGIAVENVSLYQQTAMKAKELSALYSVAGIASESLDITTVLRKTMDEVLEIFEFDAARIYLCEGDGKELRLVAYKGFPKNAPPQDRYHPGEGFLGKAVKKGEPLIFDDMQNSPTYAQMSRRRLMLKAGFRGSFFIPIRVRGESLGMMNFLSEEPHHFSASELHLINVIAYHLAIAVGNANLFAAIEQNNRALEKANKGKNEFLGIISHELRTPLNVIKGYTELMKDGGLGEVNTQQEAALTKITDQSMDLLSMINSVLRVTTIEAEAVTIQNREFNLYEFLIDLRSNYDGIAAKKSTIRWEYPRKLPVMRTDEEKLKAILQNLINNAIKFTDQGEIVVSVQCLPVNEIQFKVADTGIGIPKERLPFIFNMFEQVDSSVTRRHGGVGLGLYISWKFTELLDGRIEVESEMGRGSTFTLTLPLAGELRPTPAENYDPLLAHPREF